MKQNLFPAIRLTLIMLILCSGVYSLIVLGIAKLTPDKGYGEMIADKNGKTYYANIGQKFDRDDYFNSRPSAGGYNASGSGGSNKGPNNEEYLKEIQQRINDFKSKNPGAEIPVDMVTASGSGLDPDISVAAANAQVKRIAQKRGLSETALFTLIIQTKDKGFLGTEKVNVLKLNIALDKLK
ncbi:MAG: potassium-transporting ATPase subunit C [Chitinophagaceae bacterium]|jgi:K+-transporting ATPase ATPase C chain|nr:potassium-transporting ATPase subunit C [Chitinophagaceae bacterium]